MQVLFLLLLLLLRILRLLLLLLTEELMRAPAQTSLLGNHEHWPTVTLTTRLGDMRDKGFPLFGALQ